MADSQLDRIENLLLNLIEQTKPAAPAEDQKVFRDPSAKYWDGPSYSGQQLSQCPPEYLLALAKYKRACAFMAKKEGDPEKLKYVDRDEMTAALATQWATYLSRGGKKPAVSAPKQEAWEDQF
jgi:hypothetical protein